MMGAFAAWMMLNYLGMGYWTALVFGPVIVALTGVVMESRQSPDIPPGEDGAGPVTSGDVAAADNGRDAAASDSGS